MADITTRANAAKHRQHDQRFQELTQGLAHAVSEIQNIQARIIERERAGATPELIRPLEQRIARLDERVNTIASDLARFVQQQPNYGPQLVQFSHDLEATLGRVEALEAWRIQTDARLDQVETCANDAYATATATAASYQADQIGRWWPLAAALGGGVFTYLFIELFLDHFSTRTQWAWTLAVAGACALLVACLPTSVGSGTASSASSSSRVRAGGNGGTTPPAPPTQPVPVVLDPVVNPPGQPVRALPAETPQQAADRILADTRAGSTARVSHN